MKELLEILTYMRPAFGYGEKMMIKNHIDNIPNVRTDNFGNRIVIVGDSPTTLFSCHTDTVHNKDGTQRIDYNNNTGIIYNSGSDGISFKGEPLGADDGAGIYILKRMIEAQVKGLYIFHAAEEQGGLGSSYIELSTPDVLNGIDRAIAFDRRGTGDVITHQYLGRCCSDEFALDLSMKLNEFYMEYMPSDKGSFTDTANYSGLISECTNISCGYYNEHSGKEHLDTNHVLSLVEACIRLDWDNLPTVRPKDYNDFDDEYNMHGEYISFNDTVSWNTLFKFICDNPALAANILFDKHTTDKEMQDEIRYNDIEVNGKF